MSDIPSPPPRNASLPVPATSPVLKSSSAENLINSIQTIRNKRWISFLLHLVTIWLSWLVFSKLLGWNRPKSKIPGLFMKGTGLDSKYLASSTGDAFPIEVDLGSNRKSTKMAKVEVWDAKKNDWSKPSTLSTGKSSLQRVVFPARVIHQSWKDENLPKSFAHWSTSWKKLHPDWEYRLWTDEMNLELCRRHFSWFYHTYQQLPAPIQRADAARFMYMYHFGGVYSDLDSEALKPLDTLLTSTGAYVASMGNRWQQFDHDIPNAFMASSHPGHPFWLLCLSMIMDRFWKEGSEGWKQKMGQIGGVELLAGPILLRDALMVWNSPESVQGVIMGSEGELRDDVIKIPGDGPYQSNHAGQKGFHAALHILPAPLIFPFDWSIASEDVRNACWVLRKGEATGFDETRCKKYAQEVDHGKGAWVVQYWSKTWAAGMEKIS